MKRKTKDKLKKIAIIVPILLAVGEGLRYAGNLDDETISLISTMLGTTGVIALKIFGFIKL